MLGKRTIQMVNLKALSRDRVLSQSQKLGGRALSLRSVACMSKLNAATDCVKVEDLFYNVPSRRRAFRSASEEYAKILEMVGRYAVHCSGVAFSCKKAGDNSGSAVSVPASAETKDRIRQIHGSAAANELVSLQAEDQRWGFKCEGWVSNANYSSKRTNLLLFINHRAVDSQAIKKSVEQTYAMFLPKGGHPFVYLSIEIEPQRVDVNVHPTKREVHFLNEDEIISVICDEIRESLSKVDTSRSFMTQSLLSNPKVLLATPMKQTTPATPDLDDTPARSASHIPNTVTKKPYENNLVRTDASARKITSMLRPERTIEEVAAEGDDDDEYEYTERNPMACRLTSVKELRAEVRDAMHNELTDIISTHTFVGIVDEQKRIAAIQGGVKLFLVDYGMLCNEYFYQVGLTDFANFGYIRFSPPMSLHDLLKIGAEQEKTSARDAAAELDWAEVIKSVEDLLITKAPLLREYFSIEITSAGELCSIPILTKGYTPSLAKLPQFLLRLGPHVNWEEEKTCFQTLLRELASFYTPESLPLPPSNLDDDNGKGKARIIEEDPEIALRRKKLRKAVEHVVFPACKARLVATKGLLKGVMEVANLKGLYRVFERC